MEKNRRLKYRKPYSLGGDKLFSLVDGVSDDGIRQLTIRLEYLSKVYPD
jgi:hypothetical protein